MNKGRGGGKVKSRKINLFAVITKLKKSSEILRDEMKICHRILEENKGLFSWKVGKIACKKSQRKYFGRNVQS